MDNSEVNSCHDHSGTKIKYNGDKTVSPSSQQTYPNIFHLKIQDMQLNSNTQLLQNNNTMYNLYTTLQSHGQYGHIRLCVFNHISTAQ